MNDILLYAIIQHDERRGSSFLNNNRQSNKRCKTVTYRIGDTYDIESKSFAYLDEALIYVKRQGYKRSDDDLKDEVADHVYTLNKVRNHLSGAVYDEQVIALFSKESDDDSSLHEF